MFKFILDRGGERKGQAEFHSSQVGVVGMAGPPSDKRIQEKEQVQG